MSGDKHDFKGPRGRLDHLLSHDNRSKHPQAAVGPAIIRSLASSGLKTSSLGTSSGSASHRHVYTGRSLDFPVKQSLQEQHHAMEHEQGNIESDGESLDASMSGLGIEIPVLRRSLERDRDMTTRRQLGGIEHLFYQAIKHGHEMISVMDKIETVYPISQVTVKRALHLLTKRHPLLKMAIKSQDGDLGGKLSFFERKRANVDFFATDREDWLNLVLEEIEKPFEDDGKPLWRCRMLNSTFSRDYLNNSSKDVSTKVKIDDRVLHSNKFRFQATFIFIMHHSIMDGRYALWIFQDFIHYLDALITGQPLDQIVQLPILPPMEQCLRDPTGEAKSLNRTLDNLDSYITFCSGSGNGQVIKDYNSKFKTEIEIGLTQKPRNNCLVFRCSMDISNAFSNACQSYKTSKTAAIITAGLLAITDLIYPAGANNKKIEIPFEYMIDLRRYFQSDVTETDVPQYPGVMSYHIPMAAHISASGSRSTSGKSFWNTAHQFSDCLRSNIKNPYIVKWIREEAAKYSENPNQPTEKGKSPFVLCVSYMGPLECVVTRKLSDRMRLTDSHGHSSILVDDMPIFFLTMFTLNGQLCGNVSFCDGYTSEQTASEYIGHLLKYLHLNSKL